MSEKKTAWPKFSQKVVKYLVKLVLKDDVDRLISSSVANELRLQRLWAAGVRILYLRRESGVGYTIEWKDFDDALNETKRLGYDDCRNFDD